MTSGIEPSPSPERSATGPATSGPETFLMTDIEGSTRLWEQHRDRMAEALALHDRILSEVVRAQGGRIVKTTGDGMLVAFDHVADALHAAATIQRRLGAVAWPATGPLRVRTALHTGEAVRRDDDVFGPAVNRTARLLAVAHGGQVLLSAATAALARNELAPDTDLSLRDCGEHRLRDLERPEHVFELVAPDLPSDFPPLRSLDAARTNVPIQLTSFIGRERELASVIELASDHRLVSLIGVGGTGKTRLMLQAGAEMVDSYPQGVWLVELAPIADPSLVVPQVVRGLGVAEEPHREPIDNLLDYLRGKSLLVLLDNCEHLIVAAADLVERVLANCPSTAIVATSREALGIPGEVVYQVPSLSVPPPPAQRENELVAAGAEPAMDALGRSEAVRLFVERAQSALPTFGLTRENAPVVGDICRRLDGIPLALELAAARVTVLSVQEIDAGLGDRFRLLTGGRRGALPRQQTLQALIDWSWELLSDSDRRFLARLSVFAGSWTLESAASIVATADGTPADRIATLDGLARLVDRSLVSVDRGEATRYRMLETIRQYARDRLVASGDAEHVRRAHLSFFLDLAERAEKPLMGPDMVPWLRRVDDEIDELRTALDWGLEADPEKAIRLAVSLVPYWRARAFGSEAVDAIARAADIAESLPPPPSDGARERDRLVARALAAAAYAESVWGSGLLAPRYAERALERARESGDREALLDALSAQAMARVFSGHAEGLRELHDEVSGLAEEQGDAFSLAMQEAAASLTELAAGNIAAVDRRLERATAAAARTGNPFAIGFVALNRGRTAGFAGRLDAAREWFGKAIEQYRAIGDQRFEFIARSDLGHAMRHSGAIDEARALYRETIRLWEHVGSRGAVANQLEAFAFLEIDARNPAGAPRAARLLGAAEGLRELAGSAMLPPERMEYEAAVARLRATLDAAEIDREWRAGRAMPMDEAIEFAIAGNG